MDPVLYYKIYKEGVDKQIIIKYTEPVEPFSVYHTVTDHI